MEGIEKLIAEIRQADKNHMLSLSYLLYLIEDMKDEFGPFDGELDASMSSEVKMRLYEESKVDLPMSRDEAEDYIMDLLPDETWEHISDDGMTSTSAVKKLDDLDTLSLYEYLKTLPLVPFAKAIMTVLKNLMDFQSTAISEEMEENMELLILQILSRNAGESLGFDGMDLLDSSDMDELDDDEDEDDDDEDDEDDKDYDIEELMQILESEKTGHKSRITKFPGKK
jgi:hypothetical protein